MAVAKGSFWQSLFLEDPWERERKTSMRTNVTVSVTVSVTWERRCRDPLVAWALGDERTPTPLAARSIAAPTLRSHAYLFCVLSHGFSKKGDCSQSMAVGTHLSSGCRASGRCSEIKIKVNIYELSAGTKKSFCCREVSEGTRLGSLSNDDGEVEGDA